MIMVDFVVFVYSTLLPGGMYPSRKCPVLNKSIIILLLPAGLPARCSLCKRPLKVQIQGLRGLGSFDSRTSSEWMFVELVYR
jgi:hypothetical protein